MTRLPLSDVEAVLMTGGASRRMGRDKAQLRIEGEALGERLACLIASVGVPVTVLGRAPLAGHAFVEDRDEFAGPLAALAAFMPGRPFLFIASCDLPGFDPALILELRERIGRLDAAIPVWDGRRQPLCALYRSEALAKIDTHERRVMRWIEQLDVVEVEGLDPIWLANVNTPEDLDRYSPR